MKTADPRWWWSSQSLSLEETSKQKPLRMRSVDRVTNTEKPERRRQKPQAPSETTHAHLPAFRGPRLAGPQASQAENEMCLLRQIRRTRSVACSFNQVRLPGHSGQPRVETRGSGVPRQSPRLTSPPPDTGRARKK